MDMSVNESRRQCATLPANNARLLSAKGFCLFVTSHIHDAIAPDGNCFCMWIGFVAGKYLCVDNNDVGWCGHLDVSVRQDNFSDLCWLSTRKDEHQRVGEVG